MDSRDWPPADNDQLLFCWEAFVSGSAHTKIHVRDAATAAKAFLAVESDLASANAVTAAEPLSLLGAVALWCGWTSDLAVLKQSAIVIKPTAPFLGDITVA